MENKVCEECKEDGNLQVDHVRGLLVCTRCGLVASQHVGVVSADRRTGTVGSSEADVDEEESGRSKNVKFDTRRKRHAGDEDDEVVYDRNGQRKNVRFLKLADNYIYEILRLPTFCMDPYSSTARPFFTPAQLRDLYYEAAKYPRYLWSVLIRAMEAHYYAAASIHIACLRAGYPMSVSHLAYCLMRVWDKCDDVTQVKRKISNCIRSLTSRERFETLQIDYVSGVFQFIKTMAWLPEIPRYLTVQARNRSHGGQSVTADNGLNGQFKNMSLEDRAKYRLQIKDGMYDEFIEECKVVLDAFVELTQQSISTLKNEVLRASIFEGDTQKIVDNAIAEKVLSHCYTGRARRTRKSPGIALGEFTASVERLGIAIIVFVLKRGDNPQKYGTVYWRSFNYKTCQLARLRTRIRDVLTANGQENVGLTSFKQGSRSEQLMRICEEAKLASERVRSLRTVEDEQEEMRRSILAENPEDETMRMFAESGMTITDSSKKRKRTGNDNQALVTKKQKIKMLDDLINSVKRIMQEVQAQQNPIGAIAAAAAAAAIRSVRG